MKIALFSRSSDSYQASSTSWPHADNRTAIQCAPHSVSSAPEQDRAFRRPLFCRYLSLWELSAKLTTIPMCTHMKTSRTTWWIHRTSLKAGLARAWGSSLYLVLSTVTSPIIRLSVGSVHVSTLQVSIELGAIVTIVSFRSLLSPHGHTRSLSLISVGKVCLRAKWSIGAQDYLRFL